MYQVNSNGLIRIGIIKRELRYMDPSFHWKIGVSGRVEGSWSTESQV